MYISGFHIDGFGIYHDQGVLGLPRGLVLFLGENESGKTTLMEYLRTLLFGFPRKTKKIINEYEPLRGGNHGGRLQVIMQDGRQFTIERSGRLPATLAQAGGGRMQGEPAQHLLGGLDRETFKHVFAVGLDELQGLGVLTQDGVRGRLFAAGAGLGSASVPEVMEKLKKASEALLKKGGRTQEINLLLNESKKIEAQIKNLQGQAAAYAEGQRQREHLEARVRANRQEAEGLRRELGRLDRLEQARLPWVNRNRAREQAVEMEFARDFPINGLERLESLDRELDQVRQGREGKAEEIARLQEQLDGLALDAAVLAQQEAIETLGDERVHLTKAQDDYPGAQSDLEQARQELGRKLRELGPAWDEARLAAVDTSLQVRQQVAEFGRRLAAAERQAERARTQARLMAEAAEEAQRRLEAAAQRRLDFPVPAIRAPQVLQVHQEAVRRLRVWWHRREVMAEKLRAKVSAQEEADVRVEGLMVQPPAAAANMPWWVALPWLAAGLGLGGWFLYQRAYLAGGLIAGAGVALAGLFLWLSRRQAAADERRRAGLQQELEQAEEKRTALKDAVIDLEGQIDAADAEIILAAQALDCEPPADAMALEEIAGELDQAAAQLRDWLALEQEKRQAEDHLAQARVKVEQAEAESRQAEDDLARLQGEWAGWLSERGFADPGRPESFEAVLQAVENARAAAGVLEAQRRRLNLMSDYLTSARERIAQVLAACGRRPRGTEPGVEDLDALRRALSAALAISQQQKELAGQLSRAAGELELLEKRRQEGEGERRDLLRKAGAADAEDFRRRGAAFQAWQVLRQEVNEEETALRRMAGTREAQAALEEELSRTDPLALQEEKARLAARWQELEGTIAGDNQEIGDLKGRLKMMEQDEQLSELLFRHRTVHEQLADAIRRWATLAVCRHLLDEARGVYERERQPQVIREADGFLNTMAQGRYRLLAAVGEDGVHLEDRSLTRKEELSWSAGLADQVYLAIRLGLAREFGRHTEPLPVILDDVLVKFDPSRRANTARVMLDFARTQQVLCFSCHPEFLEIIRTVRREARYQETPLAGFAIADGVISRIEAGLLGGQSPA
ncbi:MAG: AAA family ATPase [Desulfobaccales bacterium]